MPKYPIRTLTIKAVHELEDAGFINIIKSQAVNDTRRRPAQLFDISVLVNNYESFGLTPVIKRTPTKIHTPSLPCTPPETCDPFITRTSHANLIPQITRTSTIERTSPISRTQSILRAPNTISVHNESPPNDIHLMDDNNSAPRKKNVKSEVNRSECQAKNIKTEMKAGSGDLQPNLTPGAYQWLKDVKGKVKNRFQNKRATTLKDVHIVATQTQMDIGGEQVIVNIIPDDDDIDGLKKCYIATPPTYTPVNYEETYDYFEKLNTNRQQLSRAIYCIGDMLINDELEGDAVAWKQHTDKVDEEYIAWKKKCRQSNDLFEKTGLILGYNDTRYKRFLLRMPKWLRRFFPCC